MNYLLTILVFLISWYIYDVNFVKSFNILDTKPQGYLQKIEDKNNNCKSLKMYNVYEIIHNGHYFYYIKTNKNTLEKIPYFEKINCGDILELIDKGFYEYKSL